jgi:hypothetical protein
MPPCTRTGVSAPHELGPRPDALRSFALPGPFGFAQGRLAWAPIPTRAWRALRHGPIGWSFYVDVNRGGGLSPGWINVERPTTQLC